MHQGSEVARLRQQITAEYEAMKLGISGLSSGSATHKFITARLHRVDLCCDQLQGHVGEREATRIICELYNEVMK